MMAQSVCGAAGLPPTYGVDVGKPSALFGEALARPEDEDGYGVDLTKTVFIGDTLETDIELANKQGMYSVLVMTGTTSEEDLDQEDRLMRQPTWVVNSVRHLPSRSS